MIKRHIIVWFIMAALRLSQLAIDYNYQYPDQHWQGPEVAYHMTHGYGHLTWQWIIPQPIRNPIYPLYLSLPYSIALHLELNDHFKQVGVRAMQILLALLCDWYLLKTAVMYLPGLSGGWLLLLTTNWYCFSTMNRTYSNSAQTALTVMAFYYWIRRGQKARYDAMSRVVVGVCFAMRPTSVIPWAVIWPYELTKHPNKLRFIVRNVITIMYMMGLSYLVGRWWYGKETWTDYNFFKWSELYGKEPLLYYFTHSIPYMLGPYILPLIIAIPDLLKMMPAVVSRRKQGQEKKRTQQSKGSVLRDLLQKYRHSELFLLTGIILLILSMTGHKQHRFILMLLPFLLILSVKGFTSLRNWKSIIFLCVIINLVMYASITVVGKTGSTDMLRQIREKIDIKRQQAEEPTLIYLCQPHSLPLFSVLQRNISVKLLDTSPMAKLNHFDQVTQLQTNPQSLYESLKQGSDPTWVLVRAKYALGQNRKFNPAYHFLMERGYINIESFPRDVTVWEEWLLGWDGLMLLSKGEKAAQRTDRKS